MGVDTVGLRYDGEFPNAAELNELLLELQTVLVSNGIPSSMLQWPVKATGPLDMNGNPILNTSSAGGEIRVNASKTLTSAIGDLPSTGGTIIIDPGYSADTSAAGDTITLDGVTIKSSGGGGINAVSRSTSGPALKVTGNNFKLEDVVVTGDAGLTNITAALELEDLDAARINSCVFTELSCVGLRTVRGTGHCSGAVIANNVFLDNMNTVIEICDLKDSAVTSNSFSGSGAKNIELVQQTGAEILGLTISGNSIKSGTEGLYSVIGPVSSSYGGITITGNTIDCTRAYYMYAMNDVVVTGNTFNGDVRLSGTRNSIVGNVISGDTDVNELVNSRVASNTFDGAFTLVALLNGSHIMGNTFTQSVDFSAITTLLKTFSLNYTLLNFIGLIGESINLKVDNYADGVIS